VLPQVQVRLLTSTYDYRVKGAIRVEQLGFVLGNGEIDLQTPEENERRRERT
jgi:hypothetical protein